MSNSDDEITPETTFKASLGGWSKLIVPFALFVLAIVGREVSWEKRFSDLLLLITNQTIQTSTYQEGAVRLDESQQNSIDNNSDRIDALYQRTQ